jgi:gas vesicle protein
MRFVKFAGGILFGAAVGAAVASFLAPQSGPRLQTQTRDLIDEAKRQGDLAQAEETETLERRFREKVNDPNALTPRETPV